MNSEKHHPWFGLDDVGDEAISSMSFHDPKPLYNEKSQQEQDKALSNPEQSIDKDPDKPWVQGKDDAGKPNEPDATMEENGDPPIDEWAEPGKRKKDRPDSR